MVDEDGLLERDTKLFGELLDEGFYDEVYLFTYSKEDFAYLRECISQGRIAKKFKVRNIPTMILFKNGQEIKRFIGVKSKKQLMKEILAFAG